MWEEEKAHRMMILPCNFTYLLCSISMDRKEIVLLLYLSRKVSITKCFCVFLIFWNFLLKGNIEQLS